MNSPIGQLTADGYDYQFGTNVIGHFLLTKSLLPLLRAGAQESPSGNARVINMTSSAIHFASQLNLEAMKDVTALRKLGSAQMYLQSKLVRYINSVFFKNKNAHFSGKFGSIKRNFSAIQRRGYCICRRQPW